MDSKTHFKLDSVEDVKATMTVTASIKEWRLLIEGAQLYEAGSEDWYRWMANAVLQNFYSEIRGMLRQVEQAQLTSAHRTAAVLDGKFEAAERWRTNG